MFKGKRHYKFQLLFAVTLLSLLIYSVSSLNNDKPRVVVVLKALETESEYWKILSQGAKKAFKDFNVEGQILGTANLQVTEQIEILADVLEQKPDALIVAPIQPTPTISVLKKYQNKNIPVLLVDTELDWDGQTMYIGTDNHSLGVRSGQLLGSMLQPGNQVALIHSTNVNPDMVKRLKGSRESLEAIGIKVVMESAADSESGEVERAIDEIIRLYPNIDGVFAANDTIAINSLNLLEEKGYNIPVVGTDGTMKMLEIVEEGRINASIAQNPYDMGYLSVVYAIRSIEGELGTKRVNTGIDIITKENSVTKINFFSKDVLK
ncbi:sugar ABC transporter substrate-binding protein [Halalkalibacter flavus]|uniref:sugar ABC transporter substrate-binding protein n=1 Tax=Halalkalibacter flavus TaxID=3090668 RepID=UPI002FCAAF8E